jgi:predicted ATPase
MIKLVEFRNFRALRDANLPLERFTLVIGPNGSGKSTAIQALSGAIHGSYSFREVATVGLAPGQAVEALLRFEAPFEGLVRQTVWDDSDRTRVEYAGFELTREQKKQTDQRLQRLRRFSLDPVAIAAPVALQPTPQIGDTGHGLASVLDRLRDSEPERFEALNQEMSRWLPEFDRFLFNVPAEGQRGFMLRTRSGQNSIAARDLSQGTLLAIAILTLAYLPNPPSLLCLEEPDRGIHPRLLREIQDALYRLSYPENYGEKREAVQVLVTTHSPYLLDLYKDHPEQIVVSQKVGNEARFERLSDQPHIEEMLEGASLGEIWYSGILGGVPCEP